MTAVLRNVMHCVALMLANSKLLTVTVNCVQWMKCV